MTVTAVTPPDPVPTAEDYRRADEILSGVTGPPGDSTMRDLIAGAVAVARTGGAAEDYLRRQLTRRLRRPAR